MKDVQYAGTYLIAGGVQTLDMLIQRLHKEGVALPGSPDLFTRVYRKFGVDEAEEIRARARLKPVRDERRVVAFFASAPTTEAQNALLKTFEDPAGNPLFFMVTPSPETLLATVRSRAQRLEVSGGEETDVEAFIVATREKRLEMLKPLYEHDANEGRDMASVHAFLHALERRFAEEKMSAERAEALHAIYRAEKFVGDKGSLLKALLEQVALLTPKL